MFKVDLVLFLILAAIVIAARLLVHRLPVMDKKGALAAPQPSLEALRHAAKESAPVLQGRSYSPGARRRQRRIHLRMARA